MTYLKLIFESALAFDAFYQVSEIKITSWNINYSNHPLLLSLLLQVISSSALLEKGLCMKLNKVQSILEI